MTDARMPGHWLYQPQLDGLSDRSWRTFVGSLMWSADQGTDGHLPDHALRFLYPSGVDEATTDELVNTMKWQRLPAGYLVVDWEKSQSMAADVEHQRERNRLNQAARRARARGEDIYEPTVTGDVSDDVSDDNTEHVPGDESEYAGGKARDRQGAVTTEIELDESAAQRQSRVHRIAAETGCYECQRRNGFGAFDPCPQHRESA